MPHTGFQITKIHQKQGKLDFTNFPCKFKHVLIASISGHRPVVPGCAGFAMAHPDFCRLVNPISTRGDRLFPQIPTQFHVASYVPVK